jgi:hypothetical protein
LVDTVSTNWPGSGSAVDVVVEKTDEYAMPVRLEAAGGSPCHRELERFKRQADAVTLLGQRTEF